MAAALALAATTCAPGASGSPRKNVAAAEASAPVVLHTASVARGLDEEELRALLQKELGASVVDTAPDGAAVRGTLYLDISESDVTARFENADGTVTQRTVPLPAGRDRMRTTIVVLAGNVARDEAAELRAQLRRRRAPDSASASASTDAAEPAPDSERDSETDSAARTSPTPDAPAPEAKSAAAATPPVPPEQSLDVPPPCTAIDGQPTFWGGADFIPMVGMSLAARDAVLHASLNVIGGLAGGVRGFQLGSVFNIVTGQSCGAQIAGVLNVARATKGVQIAGVVNTVKSARGSQIAGVVNVTEAMYGAQIAGALNLAGRVRGAQIAGAVNATGSAAALQIAGALNVATDVRGAQIAGAVNIASKVRGLQLGAVDITAGPVDGAQIGVFNIAGRVHGAQIGVFNVAEESDASIGLFSIVKRGRYHLDVWGAETGIFTAAFKHGGRYFHNFYGVGIRPLDGKTLVAFNLGAGGHIPLSRRFFLDIDSLLYSVHDTESFRAPPAFLAQLRAMVGLQIASGFAIFAGPSYNVSLATTPDIGSLSVLGSTRLYDSATLLVDGWPGASLGVQAF